MTKPTGPYVLWQDYGTEGWMHTSGNTVDELLTLLHGGPWCITGGPLNIGVIKTRTTPSKKNGEPKKKA